VKYLGIALFLFVAWCHHAVFWITRTTIVTTSCDLFPFMPK